MTNNKPDDTVKLKHMTIKEFAYYIIWSFCLVFSYLPIMIGNLAVDKFNKSYYAKLVDTQPEEWACNCPNCRILHRKIINRTN
jgi:hypothetical protein